MAALSRITTASLVVLALTACAGLPRERGYAETRDLIASRHAMPADWTAPQAGDAVSLYPGTCRALTSAILAGSRWHMR